MASLKHGAIAASTLMLIAVLASACNQPYSQQPSVTNTPIDQNSLFATPLAQTPIISMSDVASFGTGTALAGLATQTPSNPIDATSQSLTATVTPTPLITINTSTATLAAVGTLPTALPAGSRPATYTLQKGEFPYCISRRFDVNPDDLLSLNGLSSGNLYYPNLTLKIPQSGSFPGARALRTHPVTYTVAAADETIYSVACKFGDVDPSAIAQANNVSPGAALTSGQQLSIP